ncbi:MAG: methyltransferase domain-containing protein [Nitrospiraceae bacterium]
MLRQVAAALSLSAERQLSSRVVGGVGHRVVFREMGNAMHVNLQLLQGDRLDCSLRRFFVDEFYMHHAAQLKPGSRVLDLGGQKAPKRGRFDIERYDVRVRYANLSAAHRPDVQTDASALPFKEESFDAVICAEMVEHVADPMRVMHEVHRVLRRRGILLMTVPFLFPIHEDPYDYCRYTDHYWRENLERIGFEDMAIEAQGLFWSVVVDMTRAWFNEQVRRGRPRSVLLQRLITRLVTKGKRLAVARERRIDAVDHAFIKRYTTGYGIRVVRS